MSKEQLKSNATSIEMVFEKKNYIFMAIGVVLIILGLVFLSGGGSSDPTKFNDAMFDFRRLYIGPLVMLAGFGIEIYAIMHKPKKQ